MRRGVLVLAFAAVVLAAGSTSDAQPPSGQPSSLANAALPVAVPPPLSAQVSLTPSAVFFGDPVTALVTVDLDTRTVVAATLRVATDFDPFQATGPPKVSTTTVGSEETASFRYTLLCLGDGCLPTGSTRIVALPSVRVTADAGRTHLDVTARVPPLQVSSRLDASDLSASSAPFRWPTTMPAPTYRTSPGRLADAFFAAAALLGLVAAGVIGYALAHLVVARRARGVRELSPLEAALQATREAAARPETADRRKAIGLLAAALADAGHTQLAESTEGVAWSEEPPTATRTERLVDEVEASVGSESQ